MVKRRTRRRVRGLEHRYAKPVERVIRFLFSVVSVFFSFRLQEGAALFYFRLCILLCHTRRAHKTTEKKAPKIITIRNGEKKLDRIAQYFVHE